MIGEKIEEYYRDQDEESVDQVMGAILYALDLQGHVFISAEFVGTAEILLDTEASSCRSSPVMK